MLMIDKILSDSRYIEKLNKINDIESERYYCKHDLSHSQEVVRILTALSKSRELNNYEELSAIMGYLHDIGRADDYDGMHNKCSSEFARVLLKEYEFDNDSTNIICYAIDNHSGRMPLNDIYTYIRENTVEENVNETWANLLRIADQLSRDCYKCEAASSCRWLPEEKTIEAWKC